jgi:RimJ/RimL family protein N-acetyltransferase
MGRTAKLTGEQVYLALPCPDDAELWARWLNDLEVALPLGDEAYSHFGIDDQARDIADIAAHHDHVFTIVERATDRPIGRCLLFGLNRTDRSTEIGIFIGEKDCWGKGYGGEAMRLLLDYAFTILNMNSVMLGVYAFNERAIRCYRSLGFKEIGRRREARIIGGVKYDGVLMDLLAEEFDSPALAKLMAGRPERSTANG